MVTQEDKSEGIFCMGTEVVVVQCIHVWQGADYFQKTYSLPLSLPPPPLANSGITILY